MDDRDPGEDGSGAFGESLVRMRLLAGLTQADLARRSGVSERSISLLELGRTRNPQRATLDLLAEALGLDDRARTAFHASARRGRWLDRRVRRHDAHRASPLPNRPRAELEHPLLGRSAELAALQDLLAPGTLVTICGVGGIGKSRLALAAAERARRRSAVVVVPLESLPGPGDVLPAIAAAAGLPRETATDAALLGSALPAGGLLLLDDADRLHAAARDVAHLAATSGSAVLVTSREPLGVPGERLLRLGPLRAPDLADDPPVPADRVLANPAVALFRDRAALAGRAVADGEAATVARIVAALDGLPLAIELAAAQTPFLPLDEMLALLESSGRSLLSISAAPEAGRQRTMDDTIAWTADLLPQDAQELLPVFGAFVGGVGRESLADVLADIGSPELMAALPRLLRSGLVHHAAGDRYRMLEPIRFHVSGRLDADSRRDAVRLAHARRFARLARETGARVHGPRLARALADEEAARANIIAAARWATANGHVGLAAQIVVALWAIWDFSGRRDLLRRLAEPVALEAGRIEDPELRRMARFVAAIGVGSMEGNPAARRWSEVVAAGEPDDPRSAALAAVARAWTGLDRGDPRLLADLRRAHATLREAGHPLADYGGLCLGIELAWGGDSQTALDLLADLADRFERQGNRFDHPMPLQLMGSVLLEIGRPAEARDTLLKVLRDDSPAATGRLFHTLETLAAALSLDDDPDMVRRGALLTGTIDAWETQAGVVKTAAMARRRADAIAAIAERIGADACERLIAEGRGLTLERAAAVARS